MRTIGVAGLARIIHDGSSRNREVAKRDGRVEPRETEAYLKQYVEAARGEPARQHAGQPHAGLSQRRILDCSRSAHELCALRQAGRGSIAKKPVKQVGIDHRHSRQDAIGARAREQV